MRRHKCPRCGCETLTEIETQDKYDLPATAYCRHGDEVVVMKTRPEVDSSKVTVVEV